MKVDEFKPVAETPSVVKQDNTPGKGKPGPLLGFTRPELKARIVAKAAEVHRLTEQLQDAREELENAQRAYYSRD